MDEDEHAEDDSSKLKKSQAIRAAVHFSVGQMLEEVGTEYGISFSKPTIATISEFLNRQIETYALDLEAFARHAHRTNINTEDVKLLTRRNPKLNETVKKLSDEMEAAGNSVSRKSREVPGKGAKKKTKKGPTKKRKIDEQSDVEIIES